MIFQNCPKYHEPQSGECYLENFEILRAGIIAKYYVQVMLLFVYYRSREIFGNAQETFVFTVEENNCTAPQMIPTPEMIPRPEMIPKLDRKWSLPENNEWHGFWFLTFFKIFFFFLNFFFSSAKGEIRSHQERMKRYLFILSWSH